MSKADDYNHAELIAGRLTMAHITKLVQFWQMEAQSGLLVPDGMFGPKTREDLERAIGPAPVVVPHLELPLPQLAYNRRAHVTSGYRTSDRPNHNGVDLFYRWVAGDKPDFVGDKGCATRLPNGDPKWVVPYGVHAIAAADGRIQIAGNSSTGYRCWIDHGNGWRTGYFHLLDLKISVGQMVVSGQPLGLVGDNPADTDGRHLHFELSPVDRYAPVDPAPYLVVRP